MFHSLPTWWLAVIASMASAAAWGQPLPGDANTLRLPAVLTYRSALEGYQPYREEKPIAWLQANETVYSRGGWQAYAKEASASSSVEAEASRTGLQPAPPMPGDMSGMPGMSHLPATKDKP